MSATLYFVSATFVLGIAILVFRVLVRREYRNRGHLRLRTSLCQLLAFNFWAYFAFRQLSPSWPETESHLIWRAIGWPLFVGGFTAVFLAMLILGGATMFGLRQAKAKVSGGFYRISRNPRASALLLALLGHTLLWPTRRMYGALLLCLLMLHMMILTEEEHLTRALGDEYREYQRRVPRYLLKLGSTSRSTI